MSLRCPGCGKEYPIEAGIPHFATHAQAASALHYRLGPAPAAS